jgi:hypothetical protein
MKIDHHDLPKDFEVNQRIRKHSVYRHVLQHSTPDQFRLSDDFLKIPSKDHPALEAKVIEQIQALRPHSGSSVLGRQAMGHSEGFPISSQIPESLRIKSRH